MEVLMVLKVLLVIVVLLLVSCQRSECVRCFAQFNLTLGQCNEELGEVDEDDCCMNPNYGYQATDGVCRACGPPVWSTWSSWSLCNVLCGDGVMETRRTCYGFGECQNAKDYIHTQPCRGSCCDAKGWADWTSWSTCSITCGGVEGLRTRKRDCASPPDCLSACSGPSQETENCLSVNPCPVHGSWSTWSDWSNCSGACISGVVPTRKRQRTCSSPAPSTDTVPPGDSCQGQVVQVQDCSGLPNCPVDGNWGAWSLPGPCSVTCGEGLKMSNRRCNNPTPQYGGQDCKGPSTKADPCQSPCPVHGFWSGWSSWGECSSTCIPPDQEVTRARQRLCSNPAPSSSPPGTGCPGNSRETQICKELPHCPVHGEWGSWSHFSSCPVTCGVGQQVSTRKCDSPAPKHRGNSCPGPGRQTKICKTTEHCPVDGEWSEWTAWSACKPPFPNLKITCTLNYGSQTHERKCLHRAHNGSICPPGRLTETRLCYDVHHCDKVTMRDKLTGNWTAWEPWSFCRPPCGAAKSLRTRVRICKPDYEKQGYRSSIGSRHEKPSYVGTPRAYCEPDGGKRMEVEPCVNLPACT